MALATPLNGANRALALATTAFAANFAVWILYAVLGLELDQRLNLTATELGLIFSAPMLTGALLRIPAGLLTERYNPKHLFTVQMLLVVPALLLISYMETIEHYILLGFWLGISGASFTIGIRYVSDWFERNSQGTVLGIFGAGNAGAAITLAVAPLLIHQWGWDSIGPAYAAGLMSIALTFALFAPTHPQIKTLNKIAPITSEIMHPRVWRIGLYYYFVFGSFLALIMWLPQYYVNAYELSYEQAMAFTLLFATSSSMVRAIGGWFSDRYGGRSVNWTVFWICIVCLFFLSYPPTSMTIHGVDRDVHLNIEINVWVFTLLIFIIGIAQGFGRASVYKIIHDHYPSKMGSVGGFVAALGALGGCTLPVAFGLTVDAVGIYSACFMLLYGVLACCMVVMFFANNADRFRDRLREAKQFNFLNED